jgi:hypothetical protein
MCYAHQHAVGHCVTTALNLFLPARTDPWVALFDRT